MTLFKKRGDSSRQNQPETASTDAGSNPYMNAKALWNHQFEAMERRNYNLIRILALSGGIIALQAVGLVYMGTQSKIKPVVAFVQNGAVLSVQDVASAPSGLTDKMVANVLGTFVTNWRSLTPDNDIEKYWITSNYAHVMGDASSILQNYYNQNPPDQLSSQYKISVVINNELKLADNNYQIIWTENKESLQGMPISQTQYTAQISYALNPDAVTDDIATYNPFGVFIKNLTWSQNLNN